VGANSVEGVGAKSIEGGTEVILKCDLCTCLVIDPHFYLYLP